jgi:hypothetical protein
MEVRVEDDTDNILITISDVPGEAYSYLKHCFFQETHNTFNKRYSKNDLLFPHDTAVIERNIERNIDEMLRIGSKKIRMDWETSLVKLIELLDAASIRWWLAGSAACCIRGISIQPNDIDVMTYESEIQKFQNLGNEYIIEPFHSINDWVVKGFGVLYIHGRIDVAFEPIESVDDNGRLDFGVYASNHLRLVNWKGFDVLVPPLELHLMSNRLRNRLDRIIKIEEFMLKNPSGNCFPEGKFVNNSSTVGLEISGNDDKTCKALLN